MKIIVGNVVWLAVTAGVFLWGSWEFWQRSHFKGSDVLEYVGITFVVGSVAGLMGGGAAALGARLLGKPLRAALTSGYFIGLNLVAWLMLSVIPGQIE